MLSFFFRDLYERLRYRPKPMTGFWHTLTPEQQKAALEVEDDGTSNPQEVRMRKWWLSWWYDPTGSEFELNSPWWCSGSRGVEFEEDSICAAVMAPSEEAAKEVVRKSYDTYPVPDLEWRFCEERPSDWSPFTSRFPKVTWMKWE